MIYLDPSALVELVVLHPRGRALARWLNADPGRAAVTSVLSEVEVTAALRRGHPELLVHVPRTMSVVSTCALQEPVRHLAAVLAGHPRSRLDPTVAVHVATALVVLGRGHHTFVTCDPVTAAAARARGLHVLPRPAGPGARPARRAGAPAAG